MRDFIVVSKEEANELLGILSDLPIRYLSQVRSIQLFFNSKFEATENSEAPAEICTYNKPE